MTKSIDDILTTKPQTAADVLDAYRTISTTNQLTPNERDGYTTGFLMGLTYALACNRENNITDAARTLITLYNEHQHLKDHP